jgi:hypothetical protein
MSSIPYKHETNNDLHNFIIQNDTGRKFSFLIKESIDTYSKIYLRKSDFTIDDNTIMFRFRESE